MDVATKNILPRITGTFSLCGSLIIIHKVLRHDKGKLSGPYHRLLFCLSLFDVFSSAGYIWGSSALPEETNIPGAQGTFTTCRIQGFLFQLGMAVPFYFFFLTCYFLCSIKYGMKNQLFSKKIEPFMHLVGFCYPSGTATMGVVLKIFNPVGNGCWVSEYPKDCSKPNATISCIYGEEANKIIWLFGGIVVIFFFLVPLNMFMLYHFVRKQALQMRKYDSVQEKIRIESNKRLGSRTSKVDERKVAVAHQAMSFFLAYLVVWIMPIITFLLRMYSKDSESPTWMSILYNTLFPLQGFLNFCVYIRPMALKLRKKNPTFSFLKCVILEVFYPASSYPNRQKCQRSKNDNKSAVQTVSDSSGGSNEIRISRVRIMLHRLSGHEMMSRFSAKSNVHGSKSQNEELKEKSKSVISPKTQLQCEGVINNFDNSDYSKVSKCTEHETKDYPIFFSSQNSGSVFSNTDLDNREGKESPSVTGEQSFIPEQDPEEIESDRREVKAEGGCKRRVSIGELDFPGIALFQDLDLPEIDLDEAMSYARNEL